MSVKFSHKGFPQECALNMHSILIHPTEKAHEVSNKVLTLNMHLPSASREGSAFSSAAGNIGLPINPPPNSNVVCLVFSAILGRTL